ncbi:hypothetical protein H4R34_000084 [Dimargaris verticillata]|uniref:GTP cyclohydrolase 1 n=1 Tax=Dimargaris verticillata TaxID=2761393 RepID=A0A9W8BDZ4_9FUNG|nr:hypothetical protein H4R34_000084 [Dimargaris verticillata]
MTAPACIRLPGKPWELNGDANAHSDITPPATAVALPDSLDKFTYASQDQAPLQLITSQKKLDRASKRLPMPDAVDIDGLSWPSIGTKQRLDESPEEKEARVAKITGAVKTILECIGEDPARDGLLKTPNRYAQALMFFSKGYEVNLKEVVNDAVFDENHEEMVIVRDIDVYSLCEHHLVPFTGKISIGYIPNRRVVGLSKLARIAEMFSRRLQVQERLTKQIAVALEEILKPQGVAVVMEASHMCMVMRGVQKPGSSTITSYMLGTFREDPKTREEFLSLVRR